MYLYYPLQISNVTIYCLVTHVAVTYEDSSGNFDVLLTVLLIIFISVINQLDAQNFCFTINLFHASTCFEHTCLSAGGQNCTAEAWNKLIVKQKFCASSWLITEINSSLKSYECFNLFHNYKTSVLITHIYIYIYIYIYIHNCKIETAVWWYWFT